MKNKEISSLCIFADKTKQHLWYANGTPWKILDKENLGNLISLKAKKLQSMYF